MPSAVCRTWAEHTRPSGHAARAEDAHERGHTQDTPECTPRRQPRTPHPHTQVLPLLIWEEGQPAGRPGSGSHPASLSHADRIGTKPVVFTCPSASIPRCDPNRTYQLKQPLTACFPNDYKYNLTRRTTGYGAPFPWWLWCSKPSCEPLPNVTFRFAAGRGMEAAVVFAHKGAARAVPSTVVV